MKILLLSWYFPPANDVGALRIGAIASHLQNSGHDVRVITAARSHPDMSLATDTPPEKITRTNWFDVDTFQFRTGSGSDGPPAKLAANPAPRKEPNALRTFFGEQYRHLIRMPDQQAGWLPYLLRAGRQILTTSDIDLIYASGPPFSCFVAASSLSRQFGVPWIPEYRDAWSRYVYVPKPLWRQSIDVRMENRVIAGAAGIVTVSKPWAEYYRDRFGRPTIAVYNGFDPVHVQDAITPVAAPDAPLSITYLGIMYGGLRDPSCLYQALQLSGLSPADVRISYYGPDAADIEPLAENFGVRDFVDIYPRVPYAESLRIQRRSDILLLLQSPDDPRNVPAKVFEYFAARRPIIGLGLDNGIPASLIRERGAGIYATDAQAVAEQLKLWVAEKRRNGTIADLPPSSREGLSRAEQLRHLEMFLEEVKAKQGVSAPKAIAGGRRYFAQTSFSAGTMALSETPLIVTTIDAEEAFDWSSPFSRHFRDVTQMQEQFRAHRVFERYGVIPVYLPTFPVVTQQPGAEPLKELLASGQCTIGAQLHAWVTPPFEEEVNLFNSFAGNLPQELEFEKLRILTETIEDTFQISPQVYRAGRYGIGRHTPKLLARLGYAVDTSIVPEQSYFHEGGPNFLGAPISPHWLDRDAKLLEIPLTSGYIGRIASHVTNFARHLYADQARNSLPRSLMARTGLVQRTRLTPEGTTLAEAKALVRNLLRTGVRVFTLSYHTPSLVPGNTPYVRTDADRDQLLRWLDEFYDFFLGEIGGRPTTCHQLHAIADGQSSADKASF